MTEKQKKLWDKYTENYNNLSTVLESVGIDPKMLRRVVDIKHDYDLCDFMDKVTKAIKH